MDESFPITEDDLNDIREEIDPSGNCMVCFNPCKSWSNDLFLYTCHCIYRVHPECFKEWRLRTATNRVCLICREEFDEFGVAGPEEQQEQQEEPAPVLVIRRIRYNPGVDDRIDEFLEHRRFGQGSFLEKICIVFCLTLVFTYLFGMLQALFRRA